MKASDACCLAHRKLGVLVLHLQVHLSEKYNLVYKNSPRGDNCGPWFNFKSTKSLLTA